MKKMYSDQSKLFFITIIGFLLCSSYLIYSIQIEKPIKNEEMQKLKEDIKILKIKINQLETIIKDTHNNIESAQRIYSHILARITWEFQILMGLIAILGVAITLITIGIIRKYVGELIKKKISELSMEKIESNVKEELSKVIDRYDKEMALLYRRYNAIIEKAEGKN